MWEEYINKKPPETSKLGQLGLILPLNKDNDRLTNAYNNGRMNTIIPETPKGQQCEEIRSVIPETPDKIGSVAFATEMDVESV